MSYTEDQVVVVGSVDQRVELRQFPNATRYGDDVVVVGHDGSDITPAGVATTAAVVVKSVVIQSPEHKLLLRTVPRVTMYGPEVNLV